ncbi:DUF6511 domain-containing protein [Magnetofaba australis]|nr:DUF6511 domain-containing protein [Magnetofaba australis]
MIDPTPRDEVAFRYAGQMVGEYVESIGKSDLRAFTLVEFLTLVEVAVTGYLDERARQDESAKLNDTPF